MSITYFVMVVIRKRQGNRDDRPILNKDTIEYNLAMTSGVIKVLTYLCIGLPALSFLSALMSGFTYTANLKQGNSATASDVVLKTAGFIKYYAGIIFIVTFLAYWMTRKRQWVARSNVDAFDTYVFKNLPANADIMRALRHVPKNTIEMMDTMQRAVSSVARESDPDKIAKTLFAVNLYHYFTRLGSTADTSDALSSTFNTFNFVGGLSPSGSERPSTFRPSKYLERKAVVLTDMSTSMRVYLKAPANIVDKAVRKASEMTSKATDMANSFRLESSFMPYMRMVVLVVMVNVAPPLLYSAYKKGHLAKTIFFICVFLMSLGFIVSS